MGINYGVLREYQAECSDSVASDFNSGHRRVLVVMATGGGKTVTFGHTVKRYLDKNPDKIAVIISHLGLLITQTGQSLKKFWDIDVDILQAKKIPNKNSRCILTTMQSFRDLIKLMTWGEYNRVGLIIVDEAHMMFNDSYDNIWKLLPNHLLLGVTATPFKKNQLLTGQFDKVSFTISTQELIDMGFLVKPELKYIPFDKADLEGNIRKIIEVYQKHHLYDKAIVYLKRKQDCKDMHQILESHKMRSAIVTSDITGEPRDKLLKSFKDGDKGSPDILLTVDVLTAGFDSPNIRAIFMPYPTGSVTAYLQRIGRGLRPHDNKDACMIYIGGESPELMMKEWERIQRKALNIGKRKPKDIYEELEYNRDLMTTQELVVNMRIANMAKRVRAMNMDGLHDSIAHMEVPEYLFNALYNHLPKVSKNNSKLPATPAQKAYVRNLGLRDNITKNEANLIIDAHKISKGWKPSVNEVVPSGKFRGWQWKNVPHIYKKFLYSSRTDASIRKHYEAWKQSIIKD